MREQEMRNTILLILYPIVDTAFLIESTLRLWRAGFPIRTAWNYSRNR